MFDLGYVLPFLLGGTTSMYSGYYYGFDYTYLIFILPAIILSLWAQFKVKYTFKKYSKMKSSMNLSGAGAANVVLNYNQVSGVKIKEISGSLTDHFNPKDNSISLSGPVYADTSVSAVGVAAHEAGHAVQHANGYMPIKVRSFLVPVCNFGSFLSMPLILVGFILPVKYIFFAYLGVALFSLAVLFHVVTLPVELDASRRAIRALEQSGTLYGEELEGARKVLKAAAMTYVAGMITSVLELLRLLFLLGSRKGRD